MTAAATRVREAADRILAGDDSVQVANRLETTILDDHPEGERFDALLEGLALYAPGRDRPYVGPRELQSLINEAPTQAEAPE